MNYPNERHKDQFLVFEPHERFYEMDEVCSVCKVSYDIRFLEQYNQWTEKIRLVDNFSQESAFEST